MPRKAIDYSKTIIYKIVCNDLTITDCYVGHTTDFTKRKCHHKNSCLNENYKQHNLKIYTKIRENGGWENYEMIEVEKYSCIDSNVATARERYWFEQLNANLNSDHPGRSKCEWYQSVFKPKKKVYDADYRETHRERRQELSETNRDHINQKQRENYKKRTALKKSQLS